ncbi:hypothetical protein DAI22_01g197801 [Oryza sativa Japonica Group]|nr:hypothetical protein DAI22_01g197801 [Oryza sativa Japonica Group]
MEIPNPNSQPLSPNSRHSPATRVTGAAHPRIPSVVALRRQRQRQPRLPAAAQHRHLAPQVPSATATRKHLAPAGDHERFPVVKLPTSSSSSPGACMPWQ